MDASDPPDRPPQPTEQIALAGADRRRLAAPPQQLSGPGLQGPRPDAADGRADAAGLAGRHRGPGQPARQAQDPGLQRLRLLVDGALRLSLQLLRPALDDPARPDVGPGPLRPPGPGRRLGLHRPDQLVRADHQLQADVRPPGLRGRRQSAPRPDRQEGHLQGPGPGALARVAAADPKNHLEGRTAASSPIATAGPTRSATTAGPSWSSTRTGSIRPKSPTRTSAWPIRAWSGSAATAGSRFPTSCGWPACSARTSPTPTTRSTT
jgi:hypothetical protein